MKRLTTKKVKEYMAWRTDEELRHCPDCISEACNEVIEQFNDEYPNINVTEDEIHNIEEE